jgi:hypothetical protein
MMEMQTHPPQCENSFLLCYSGKGIENVGVTSPLGCRQSAKHNRNIFNHNNSCHIPAISRHTNKRNFGGGTDETSHCSCRHSNTSFHEEIWGLAIPEANITTEKQEIREV